MTVKLKAISVVWGRSLRAVAGMAIILAAIGCALSSPASAQVQDQFQILHSFGSAGDGSGPVGLLVFDQEGNLYGVALGGVDNGGIVYELMPEGNGEWTEAILHNFPYNDPNDGYWPTGVVIDGAGNLYGTTSRGGLNDRGTVFELMPGASGQWTENILWNFCSLADCADGDGPLTPTLNPAGDLYGVTGTTAFELTPGSGGWTFNLLYTFCSLPNCTDGSFPIGSLTLDAKGNLYGETLEGGTTDGGTVFTLQPQPDGQRNEVVLHDFDVLDQAEGYDPSGGVTLHESALYATTEAGGGSGCEDAGCGTVFQLTRGSGGVINEQVLHAFSGNGLQGALPNGVVVFDDRGDLFGVTLGGGNPNDCSGLGCGVVYGMKPQGNGNWAFEVLHTFEESDGFNPVYGLTIDGKGNLYGTTYGCGSGGGVAFELSPTTQASK